MRTGHAGGEDWTADLPELLAAVLACIDATPGQPARAVWAGRTHGALAAVDTHAPGGHRWRCLATVDGSRVQRVDGVPGLRGRVPRGPIFTPSGRAPPRGECYQHEQAVDHTGRAVGWISHDTC